MPWSPGKGTLLHCSICPARQSGDAWAPTHRRSFALARHPITYTRQDGSPEEPVDTRMIEVRPHVYVSEDFARQNGMSRHIPPKVKTGRADPAPKKGRDE